MIILPNHDKRRNLEPAFNGRLQRFRSYFVSKRRPLSGFFLKKNPPCAEARNGYNKCGTALAAVFAVAFFALAMAGNAHAQVAASASAGGFGLSAGVAGSGEYLQYGERKMVGITGFVDFDTMRHLGLEGEAHFVQFRQTSDVHFTTYSAGVRYRKNIGRFQPYVKGLIGEGFFNFPYNYATGHYMVVTAGGGLDYRINRRIHIRAADAEWQYWPGFNFGTKTTPLTNLGVSTGIRFNIP